MYVLGEISYGISIENPFLTARNISVLRKVLMTLNGFVNHVIST